MKKTNENINMKLNKTMCKLAVIFVLLFSPASLLADQIEKQVMKSLETMDVQYVQRKGKYLKIVSNERKMTNLIYRSTIVTICMGKIWQPHSLTGIIEILVLNRFDHDGFLFEGGDLECDEINEIRGDRNIDFYIFSKTRSI